MKAISIRQPWAWLIVNGHKDIENRSWNTKYRGQVLIHAAQGLTRKEYDLAVSVAGEIDPLLPFSIPSFETIERGGIVGVATINDCVDSSPSPWFFGPKGFTLTNAKPLPFNPMKGRLSFFETGCWIENGELRGELEPDMEAEHP